MPREGRRPERATERLYEATVLAAGLARSGNHVALRGYVNDLDRSCLYSRNHSVNVADHVVAIHEELGTPSRDIDRRYVAALLHDIGKSAIPAEILGKPAALTADEFDLIKAHPALGAEVVAGIPELSDLAEEILYHHERVDGRGYPAGLLGDEIPVAARVLAVADTYDAMTSDRIYRRARTRVDAIEELVRCSGSQLDGEIVRAFIEVLARRTPAREICPI